MSFQPFGSTVWTPPTPTGESSQGLTTRHTTPPSGPGSPDIATPNLPSEPGMWSERYRSMSTGNMMGIGMTPMAYGDIRRPQLGDLPQNQVTSHALASPFMPGIDNGTWGPPIPQRASTQRSVSLEERLAIAEEKIRELTLENTRLRERSVTSPIGMQPNIHSSPSISTRPSVIFDNLNPAYASMGYGGLNGLGFSKLEDLDLGHQMAKHLARDGESKSAHTAPQQIISSILHGTFNFADLRIEYIQPIVWIIADHQPKNSSESSGLKAAVNALATRLGLPHSSEPATILIKAIIEHAKRLCFTSCGNYLCQQLLERGEVDDKLAFIKEIGDDLVPIASDKFGTHVLCKAIAMKELEEPISAALIKYGIFDSMKTGARRLWREYLEKCRQMKQFDIFQKINEDLAGRWADLACNNEHGSIAVQQVFEVYGSQELMEPCFKELLAEIARIANNQFGHFVVTKLIGYPHLYKQTCDAILASYPPVATTHHGVNFAKIALTEGGRASIMKYVEAICAHDDGRTPGIVAIATSSIGKAHLTFVLSCLTPSEHARIRQTCRAYSTTLRNSQSGNDLLRSLGLMHAVGSRHRAGSN
ncbi:hypothetical protein IAR55_004800 [Kwoniella newhampshirensis]|uniref:PUM-HD domain-containing protein n=1 Tax=Kwoniella newhampshirensis TaxID=1651941 RepID=A0AAW0YW11_9TREE